MNDPTQAADDARLAEEASTDAALRALAEDAGVTTVWQDYRGVVHTVGPTTSRALLVALGCPA